MSVESHPYRQLKPSSAHQNTPLSNPTTGNLFRESALLFQSQIPRHSLNKKSTDSSSTSSGTTLQSTKTQSTKTTIPTIGIVNHSNDSIHSIHSNDTGYYTPSTVRDQHHSKTTPIFPTSNRSGMISNRSQDTIDTVNHDSKLSTDEYSPQKTVRDHEKRKSKSVDLSHLYLLDRNDSTHFTLINENLVDASQLKLQKQVGDSTTSSLVPRMKTIEMYRKNVKKSTDVNVLFQYGQYMLQTALTMNPDGLKMIQEEGSEEISEQDLRKEFLKDACYYLKKLCDKGYADAQYLMADAYSSGALGKVDNKEAFSLFQAAAKHGHVESAYRTAYCFEEGLGVSRDSRRAVEFLKFASSKNHPAAMYKLGLYSFYSRMGLPNNMTVKKAGLQWLSRAADNATELTNAAPYEMGKIYDAGFLDILIPDHKYAIELYVKAASLGHAKAAAILGKAYELGDSILPQDPDLSIHYYTQAALGNDAESMLALCAWYLVGNPPNLGKNNNEAFQWALKAANLNFVKAQYAVGHFYEKGIGCKPNSEMAHFWYRRAADNGDRKAKIKLSKLESKKLETIENDSTKKHERRKSIFNLFK